MRKWYLINSNTRPNVIDGFENDAYLDYKEDAFAESLQTDIATTVILYNYDLTKSRTIRCIIQGNTADTQLRLMERVGLFMRGTVKAGMYVLFENRYWLVTGYPSTNGIYEKATLQLCQYKLRWQNRKGKIIERWMNATSASKYDTGETGNNVIMLTSDNLTLLLPDDDETLDLDGKRVFIDKRDKNPTKVYKITRTDGVLYDYGDEHGGVIAFIADKTELNPNTDNQELRICDYINISRPHHQPLPPSHEIPVLKRKIIGNPNLKVGFSRTYTIGSFNDSDEIDWNTIDYKWNVVSDFAVEQTVDGNGIELFVENEGLIGRSFLLQAVLTEDNTIISEIKITIVEGH